MPLRHMRDQSAHCARCHCASASSHGPSVVLRQTALGLPSPGQHSREAAGLRSVSKVSPSRLVQDGTALSGVRADCLSTASPRVALRDRVEYFVKMGMPKWPYPKGASASSGRAQRASACRPGDLCLAPAFANAHRLDASVNVLNLSTGGPCKRAPPPQQAPVCAAPSQLQSTTS